MRKLFFIVTLLFLAACGGIPQEATPQPSEIPLLTDADIDNAQLLLPTEVKELVGIEGGEATAEQMVTVPSDAVLSQQSTQTGILDPGSTVYYIQADSTPTNAPDVSSLVPGPTTYSIVKQYVLTGTRRLYYSGAREIQSMTRVGWWEMYVSMRETTNPNSDFEIFSIVFTNLSWDAVKSVTQLTYDNIDNTNISHYSDGSISDGTLVYEEPVSGKATLVLRTRSGDQVSTVRLSSPSPQRHPSISTDGKEIVFVRDLPSGYDSILKYTIATNTYSLVVDTTPTNDRVSAPVTLDFPSLSYNKNKVLWLENNNTVKLKNLSTGSVQTVASDPTIKRPHLNANDTDADGMFITYQQGRNVYYKNVQTAQVWALTNYTSFVTSYGAVPSFSLALPKLRVTVTGLPSGQNRVKLINPSGQVTTFGSSRTFENLSAGTYTITAESFSTGLPNKPICKIYTPTPASQTVKINFGEVKRVSVTYTVSPCNP